MNDSGKAGHAPDASPPQTTMLTIDEAMALAEQLQAQGRLQESEYLLQQILQQQSQHPFALHLLGVIAYQCGKPQVAAELMQKAIAQKDDVALFHANLGEIMRQLKRPDQAVAHGERAVALDPRLAIAHSNLGIAWFDRKEYDKAEACQQRALAVDASFAASLNNLGSIWRERRDNRAALTWYRKAAAANPHYLEPLNNLGALLLEEDRVPEALEALNKALGINPDYTEAICNMGNLQLAQEEHKAALASFRRALELRPLYLDAQMGLARTLLALDAVEEAGKTALRALEIDPASPKAHALMGSIHAESGLPEPAEQEFNRALEIDPKCDEALIGLGRLCVENGELERAQTLFRQALGLRPDSVAPRIQLVQVAKVVAGDENFASLLELEKDADSHSDNLKISLHFSLGKCYEDIEDYDNAFPHFLAGCKLKRAKLDYDPQATARQFAQLQEIFSKENIDRLRGTGDASSLPIFVLGMPRSGTTLTEQILASHPDVFGAGELPDLMRIVRRRPHVTTSFPDNLRHLDHATLRKWGAEYVAGIKRRAPEAPHITDKMPGNFFCVPLIHLMLPNAKIIHVNRNPVDTCVSCFTHLFQGKQEHTYDLAELGRYYADYARMMDNWRQVLPAGALLDIRYEDIVANQEKEARKLLAYCGLEWDDACLDFHKTRRQVRTASLTQVRQPIYNSSVERWRNYEKFLVSLLDELDELAD